MQNNSFLPGTKQQFAWDSTSSGALMKCPRYYQLSIVEGWRAPGLNVHLQFGLVYHSAGEIYSHARAKGNTHEESLHLAVRHALQATWDSVLKRGWISEDRNKNRQTLIRTIVWYLDKFEHDPIETIILANGKPAVELSFRLEMDGLTPAEAPHQPYMLCGHLDRVGQMQGQTFILDKKTTGHTIDDRYFAGFTPDNQFSTYMFAGRIIYPSPISGLIVDAAQVAVSFSRFRRGFVGRSPEQLDEWHTDLVWHIRQNEQYVKHNYWPMNPKACFMCEFRTVCSRSASQRDKFMEKDFVKRTWDPLQVRGDV